MAYSWVDLTPSAGIQNLTIGFPYLRRDHLHVYRTLDGVTEETTAFSFLTAYTIRLNSGAEEGEVIRIRRITPLESPIVDFQNGSSLGESELDLAYLHSFYVLQERVDLEGITLHLNDAGVWDFEDRSITGLVIPPRPVLHNGDTITARDSLHLVDSNSASFNVVSNAEDNQIDITVSSPVEVLSTHNTTAITNSSALTTLTTITIPAGRMGVNTRLTLDSLLTYQNNSAATRWLELSVWIGENRLGMHQFSFAHDGADLYGIRVSAIIENQSSLTSQAIWSTASIRKGPAQSAGDELGGGLLAVNTANEFSIAIKGELLAGTATQIVTHRGTKVTLL